MPSFQTCDFSLYIYIYIKAYCLSALCSAVCSGWEDQINKRPTALQTGVPTLATMTESIHHGCLNKHWGSRVRIRAG